MNSVIAGHYKIRARYKIRISIQKSPNHKKNT